MSSVPKELVAAVRAAQERVAKDNQKDLKITEVHRAEIKTHKGALMLPDDMTIDQGIQLLRERKEYLNKEVCVRRVFRAFPWDGGLALQRVLERRFGWVPGKETYGLWGDKIPPTTISVEVAYGKTAQVPWGQFALPGIDGFMETGYAMEDGQWCFNLESTVRKLFEKQIEELYDEVQAELHERSIYLGKAISVRFLDDDGDMKLPPEIRFMRTDVDPDGLIFSRSLEAILETNLFTPITRADDCKRNGIPVKRGVLLGGTYGTGKTLAAAVAANRAVKADVTYIHVPRANELKLAIQFARSYMDPACVVFCEDIDRVMEGERSIRMDDILNIIDGVDGKTQSIITVLTTNELENINPAMLRPGRLDAVIEVTPPDAEAVTRLLRYYGHGAIATDTDLSEVGKVLDGQIPAVVGEVVKRAKLAELKRMPRGSIVTNLSKEALLEAAQTMTMQINLLKPKPEEIPSDVDEALYNLMQRAADGDGPPPSSKALRLQAEMAQA